MASITINWCKQSRSEHQLALVDPLSFREPGATGSSWFERPTVVDWNQHLPIVIVYAVLLYGIAVMLIRRIAVAKGLQRPQLADLGGGISSRCRRCCFGTTEPCALSADLRDPRCCPIDGQRQRSADGLSPTLRRFGFTVFPQAQLMPCHAAQVARWAVLQQTRLPALDHLLGDFG